MMRSIIKKKRREKIRNNESEEEFIPGAWKNPQIAEMLLEPTADYSLSEYLVPWNTTQIAFAYFSEHDQDMIISKIQEWEVDWTTFKKLSIPIWVKDVEKLK
jgi:hypothetical protein